MSRNMNKRFYADFLSVLSRTLNPHDQEKCNELNHFDNPNHLLDSTEYVGKRKMSRIDIFMDQDDEEDTKGNDGKKEDNGKIGPDALVDVLA